MAVKMIGTRNCPDCTAALKTIAEKKLDVEFVDIDASTANLKLFLRLRDKAPEFDEIKKKRLHRRSMLCRREKNILRHKRAVSASGKIDIGRRVSEAPAAFRIDMNAP